MYQVMMKDQKNLLTNTNEEGRDKVLSEDYAFFMESATIEYQIERNCTLAKVGDLLDEKGYGIAMRKSKYRFLLFINKSFSLLILSKK